MDVDTFSNKGFFDNWNEMFEAYYGVDPMAMMANKTEAPYLTTTTGIRNILYGAWLTIAFAMSHNALGSMRDAPWRKSGYRIVTDAYYGSTPDGDGRDEGGAIPSSVQDTLAYLELNPKTMSNVLDISTAELAIEGKDDNAKWAELVDARRKTMMLNWNKNFLGRAAKQAYTANKGLERLDRIVASYDEYANAGESPVSGSMTYMGKTRASSATIYDCNVKHFNGVATPFSLKHIDDLVQGCWQYWDDGSFENKHMITGPKTSARIQQLHMAQFRGKLESSPVQYTIGGIKTMPGTSGLILVNMYDNIPIVVDPFVDATYGDSSTGIEKLYLIDDNYFEIAVAQPIEYQESKEYLATGYLAKRAIFHAVMECAVPGKFGGHGKLMSII